MSSYCATCGRQRNGTARFCDGCGAEFTDASPAPGDRGAVAGAAPADPAFDATRTDQPAAQPDPFASWYQPQQPGGPRGAVPDDADGTWQPTQTVYSAPTRPAGFPPPPPGSATPPQPQPPYPPVPPPTGPSRRGGRGLFIAVAVIVVLAAGGGAYAIAHSLGKNSTTQPPAQPTTGGSTPAGGTATGGTPAGGSSSSGGPRQATTPAGSPTPSPTLSLVTIGPGVASSAAVPQVETLLSHYFHGINTRDYAEYASTLNPAEQAKQSQSTFNSGYATTTDSGMTLTNLASGGGGGLVATVTFTSHQSPAQSIDHSACNTWTLNFYLVPQGTGYLIGPAPSGYQPSHSDC
ncbi:MAG TPA: hypothetical protein VF838_13720 [Trebonia sp.]